MISRFRRLWFDLAAAPERPYGRRERLVLAAVTVVGAVLRIAYQWRRPFLGDELGTLRWIEESYGYLLRHFDTWLSMNYFLVLEKAMGDLFGSGPWVLVAVPLVCGIATIPATALVARRFVAPPASLAAALLVALNPYLIHHAVTIRSYALLALFAPLALLLFCRWLRRPSWFSGASFAGCALALVLAHPNGFYPLACLALLYLASGDPWRRGARPVATLTVPSLLAVGVGLLAYAPLLGPMARAGERFHDQPPTGLEYLSPLWTDFFADGFWGWPTAALVAFAAWRAIAQRSSLQMVLALVLLPPVLVALQGVSHFPWAIARFLIFLLPLLAVLLAAGLEALARRRPLPLAALALLLALTWTPRLAERWQEQLDYPWDDLRLHLEETGRETATLALTLDLVTGHSLDPRPLGASYRRQPLARYLAAGGRDDHAADASENLGEPAVVILALRELAPKCGREHHTFGRLTAVTLEETARHPVARQVETCLLGLVIGRWPVEARFEPVYGALLELAARRGDALAVKRFHTLQRATAPLDERRRWMTPKMHRLDAERASRIEQRRWKQTHRATDRPSPPPPVSPLGDPP